MLNDPFWLSREQAAALTDRQAIEWYIKRYPPDEDKQAAKEFDETVQAEIARREREDEKKSLDQKKAEYWGMCRDAGCREKDIQAMWEQYLKTGATT